MSIDLCDKKVRNKESNKQTNKESNKQSKSGWGGKRAGAGAPFGNNNAVKHGERSSLAFFPLEGEEDMEPLFALRVRNLLLATWIGEIYRERGCVYGDHIDDKRINRLLRLYHGLMWQHVDVIIRVTRRTAMAELEAVKQELREAKARKKAGLKI